MKKTIHVLLNKETDTPISEVQDSGESGTWRIGKGEEQDIKQIIIWDEETLTKTKAKVIDIVKSDTLPGFVFKFDTFKSYDVRWQNRPKVNQIGWTIRDEY